MDAADLAARLEAILLEDRDASDDSDPVEPIEALIASHGWPPVRAFLMAVLEDPERPPEHYEIAAAAFWGAVLDGREIAADRLIALVYERLHPDGASGENNLAWSITSKLRCVGYLSEYDPLSDPAVRAELATIRRTQR